VDVLLDELDLGETATIVLARELKANWVLMDEKKGRRKLDQLGMAKIGTLGLLLKAKQSGLLSTIGACRLTTRCTGLAIVKAVPCPSFWPCSFV
jgi:predicted nucleic acid-binding protein